MFLASFRKVGRSKLSSALVILTVLLTTGLGACDRKPSNQQATQSSSNPLKIALNIWPGYGAFLIAEEKNFFDAEGVKVKIEIIQGDPEREAALAAGKIDGIGMTIDNLVLLRNRGIDVKAIYKYDGSFGADGIVAKPEIKQPSDLKGRRVAWAPGTTSHFFLTQVLKKANLTTKGLDHAAMSSDDAGAAFAAGHLDAAVTWEPWLTKARESGNGHVLISTRELPVVEDVLFVRADTIKNRPEDVRKMLRACFKAVEYWKAHPKEGSEIIGKHLKLPIVDVDGMLGGIKIMSLEDNKQFFGSDGAIGPAFDAFQSASDAWIDEGLIKKKDAPESGIDPSFIRDL